MGQNNDSNNSTGGFEINVLPMILCIIVAAIAVKCCSLRKKKTVMVLCVHGSEDYKKAFESFMKKYLAVNVEWVNRPPQNEKYLVLCNAVSRIPEDIEWVFESLDLKDVKPLDDNTMIVTMRKSEIGKEVDDDENPVDPPYESKLTKIVYCQKCPLECAKTMKAKDDIQSFLGLH